MRDFAVHTVSRMLAIAVLGATALALGPPASAASGSTAWGGNDANAALSRANPSELTIMAASVPTVKLLRTLTTGGLDVSPVLSGNQVFTASGNVVSAVNASTGAQIWRQTVTTPHPECACFRWYGLSVVDGVLFVGGTDTADPDDPQGGMYALRTSTGAPIWTSELNWTLPIQRMVVSAGYVVIFGESIGAGQNVEIRRASTGADVWEKHGEGCPAQAAVIGGYVIWEHCDDGPTGNALEADRLATGVPVWSRPGTWALQRGDGDSAASGHHVYAADPSGVVTDLDPRSGATRFTLAGASAVLAVDGSFAYAACSTGLCGYGVADGARRWTQPGSATDAAVAAGVLYVANTARSGLTGTVLRSFPAGGAVAAVGNGRVAVRTSAGLALYGRPGY